MISQKLGYFCGASQHSLCICGYSGIPPYISVNHLVSFRAAFGHHTNNRAIAGNRNIKSSDIGRLKAVN